MIFLVNTDENTPPIAFKSYNFRRVTRVVLATEVIAHAGLFDEAFAVKSTREWQYQIKFSNIYSLTRNVYSL